jgi:tRNA (guanine6-N2)-methyltransferase
LRWFATTVVGLEDIAAQELEELVGVRVDVDVGKVYFEARPEAMYLVNFAARTINRLFVLLLKERFERLEDIYRLVKSINFTEVMDPDKPFAVRSERVGKHDFTSIDVSRVVGQAVIDSYVESTGKRPRVNLDNPSIEIWAYVRHDEVLVGVNTTGESLHKRRYRVYDHPAALKPTIAAAMLRIGGYAGQPLLDPLCGGGTIPIEAAHAARHLPISLFRKDYLFRNLKFHDPSFEESVSRALLERVNEGFYSIYCMDISPKHLAGAIRNAESARVRDTITFLLRDATRAESYKDVNAELVVTNPPYGIRSHRLKKIGEFYKLLLRALRDSYSGGIVVAITSSTKQLEEAAESTGVGILHSRRIMHGKLPVKIYKLKL